MKPNDDWEEQRPWERKAKALLTAGREQELRTLADRMCDESSDWELKRLDRRLVHERYLALERRLAGLQGHPVLMSHTLEPRGVVFRYIGTLGGEELLYDYVENCFSLRLAAGIIAQSNAAEKRAWSGNLLPELLHPHRRRGTVAVPTTALCIGRAEISRYLSLAGKKEENAYWELIEFFQTNRHRFGT